MTREYAAKVTKALNDIEDFEMLFDEIETTIQHTEGDFDDFCSVFSCHLTPPRS